MRRHNLLAICTLSCTPLVSSSLPRMQSTWARSEIFSTVLHSPDHARLVAAFLSTDELLAASSLSRGLHAMLDSEPVWQHRLIEALRIQHVEREPVPASAVLSPA